MRRTHCIVHAVARWSPVVLGASALVGLGVLTGCVGAAKPDKGGSREAGRDGSDAGNASFEGRDTLAALEALQEARPDTLAMALGAPPGLTEGEFSFPAGAPTMRVPLEESIESLRGEPLPSPPAGNSDAEALRLFAIGRAKMLDGKFAEALSDFERASRLDPVAGAIWREMAEAQGVLGRKAAASASFRRSVDLGTRDPRALLSLGREAIRDRDEAAGFRYLIAAREAERAMPTPFLAVIDFALADAMARTGRLLAARDLMEEGLDNLRPPSSASRSLAEIGDAFRRRADYLARWGDLSLLLEEPARAREAYQRALETPGIGSAAIMPRLVHADLRLGRSARAGRVILQHAVDSSGRVDDRISPLLAFVAENTAAGPALADEMIRAKDAMGENATPTTRSRLARAAAATLRGEAGKRLLQEQLANSPRDRESVGELLANAEDAREATRELLAMTARSPLDADLYAEALISDGRHVDESLELLGSSRSAHAGLLRACLLARLGRPASALEAFPSRGAEGVEMNAALLGARSTVATQAADAKALRECMESLESLLGESESAGVRRALSRALSNANEAERAFDVMEPLLGEGAGVDLLLHGAELAVAAGKAGAAEALLERALVADRFDERLYDALLTLQAPSGRGGEEAKFAETARRLRLAAPSSRLIRVLTAQEQIARGLWAPAEAQLLGLLDANSQSAQALELLLTVWERAHDTDTAASERGLAWVTSRLSERPQSPLLIMAHARMLAVKGEGLRAESLLVERMKTWPIPDLGRLREWIVRERLNDSERADALMRSRLETAPATPDAALELAELLVRRNELRPASAALTRAFADPILVSPDHARRLLSLLVRLKPEAVAQGSAEGAAQAVALYDLAASRGALLTAPAHISRLALLAGAFPLDTERLMEGIRELGKSSPDLQFPATVRVAESLAARPDARPVLLFLPRAAELTSPPNEQLLHEWYRLTAVRGEWTDIERFLDGADAMRVLGVLARAGDAMELPDDPTLARAELAHVMGDALSALDRQELSIAAYRKSLSMSPERGMTANNLGYLLLESGGDLEEADRLVALAHEKLPDDYHVTDSLAWVRYKRGMIHDRDGVPGAVTLLTLAVEEQGGVQDATILDHLGDALWQAGERPQAIARWRSARAIMEQELSMWERGRLPDQEGPEPPAVVRARAERALVVSKIAAAEEGKEPPVAPLAQNR